MTMAEKPISLSLTRAEGIVLAEFLLRFRDYERLEADHQAEKRLLWELAAVVETQLPELFDPEWQKLVDQSRATVLDGQT